MFRPFPLADRIRSSLSLLFRRAAYSSLASTIRQYINTKYDQHPDMFKANLEFDNLRCDAVDARELGIRPTY